MARRIQPILFPVFSFALAACATLTAQTDKGVPSGTAKATPASANEAAGLRVKKLPASALVPSGVPFAIESISSKSGHSIGVLSEDQMTRKDRDLLADAESSIQERAGFQNLDFNGSGWTYRQLDCSALPNHLFLRFTRNDGTRDMSMFSVAIPRNGDGRVHIIPIVRRGYSLFSPAPIGALTIASFNRIRSEENAGASADWLGTGLCYAALAGANPQAETLQPGSAENVDIPATFPPTLVVTTDGGAVIRFADISATPHPMEWNMIFDHKGKLLKATHAPAYIVSHSKHTPPTLDVSEAAPTASRRP
jgi:hypothetical protein